MKITKAQIPKLLNAINTATHFRMGGGELRKNDIVIVPDPIDIIMRIRPYGGYIPYHVTEQGLLCGEITGNMISFRVDGELLFITLYIIQEVNAELLCLQE